MKQWGMGVAVALLLLGLTVPAGAASNLVVGYLNSQEVFKSFTKYQAAYASLEQVRQPLEQQLKEQEEAIRELQRQLETNLMISDTRKQQLQEEIRQKYLALQQKAQENQRNLTTNEKEKIEPLLKAYNEAVKKIAAARGYNVIQELNNPALVYVDASLDITKDVIAEVNK